MDDVDRAPEVEPPLQAPGRPAFGQAVGFLLSQLGFETSRRFGLLMSELAIEPRHFAVLRAIEAMEGSPQVAIGDRIRVPASSMVAVVDQLEKLGLVERRPHPSDRRSRTLHLTPRGREVLERAVELASSLEAVLATGLTDEQRDELIALLSAVARNLELTAGIHPAGVRPAGTGRGPGAPWSGHDPPAD
jgi:DNA-binding MarR family transcriptional regulator